MPASQGLHSCTHHTYQPDQGDHNPQAMFSITGVAYVLTFFLNQNSKKTFSQEDVTTWEDSWFIKKKKKKYALWKFPPHPHKLVLFWTSF